jgi:hypothetical protein
VLNTPPDANVFVPINKYAVDIVNIVVGIAVNDILILPLYCCERQKGDGDVTDGLIKFGVELLITLFVSINKSSSPLASINAIPKYGILIALLLPAEKHVCVGV